MSVALLALILLATLLVILSGIWVTLALIDAVWYGDRRAEDVPASNPGPDAPPPDPQGRVTSHLS